MKIGILYICTGKYDIFFEDFYESCERNFLPGAEKTYYVWTDSKREVFDKPNVVLTHQEKLGWPHDSLVRFQLFSSKSEELINNDYLFFFNANMIIVEPIGREILPDFVDSKLVGVNHPGFSMTSPDNFTYERREESNFCIPLGSGKIYYQGCFNGGRANEYLEMSRILSGKISDDLSREIMPVWHDESALNWYFVNNPPLTMDPGYAYPEGWSIPYKKMITQLDKSKLGGHNFLRE